MTSLNKTEVLSMMNASLDNGLSFTASAVPASGNVSMNYTTSGTPTLGGTSSSPSGVSSNSLTCWGYWRDYYYPAVIRESYPVYIEERAKDKGKQAFEIIKVLKDKKLVDLRKVSDFIDLMDELIKIL